MHKFKKQIKKLLKKLKKLKPHPNRKKIKFLQKSVKLFLIIKQFLYYEMNLNNIKKEIINLKIKFIKLRMLIKIMLK